MGGGEFFSLHLVVSIVVVFGRSLCLHWFRFVFSMFENDVGRCVL
jgi:hypothetical protein